MCWRCSVYRREIMSVEKLSKMEFAIGEMGGRGDLSVVEATDRSPLPSQQTAGDPVG